LLFVCRPKLWRQRGSASGDLTLTKHKTPGQRRWKWCGRPNSESMLSSSCGTTSQPLAVAP
jgi:hypothetical protein